MHPSVKREVERALGASVETTKSVSGGDINQAFRVEVAGGRRVFVKQNLDADPEMFRAEAHGLAFLAEARALRVPEVVASGDRFLALEWLEPGRERPGFDDELGRGLAALHRFGAPSFGLERGNFIGRLPQPNDPKPTWASFWGERRLLTMSERAARDGLLPAALAREIEGVVKRLDQLVGPAEPPSRLHGDLWGGNLHVDERGGPCLIDPAVYGGHREVDLAMMQLFGGFSPRVFAAYDEAHPLAPGYRARIPLYQLYPLLVHVNLFGQSYVGSVRRALGAIAGG
jgi:fructosamine-3-kinase